MADAFDDYLDEFAQALRERGVRVEVDTSSDRFPKKIRTASKDKIPFVVIAGGDDAEAGTVSFRFRDGSQYNGVSQQDAVELITGHIDRRQNADPTAPAQDTPEAPEAGNGAVAADTAAGDATSGQS